MPIPSAPAAARRAPVIHRGVNIGWYFARTREIIGDEGWGPLLRALGRKLKAFLRPNTSHPGHLPAEETPAADLWDTFSAERELRKGRIGPSTGKKRVAYFTNQLLDWFDQRPRYGGGERYCLNLTHLLNDLGFEVDLYQMAPNEFVGEYHGYQVKAIRHGEFFDEFNLGAAEEFYELSRQYDYVIYNLPELSSGKMRPDAITICHGIWFDHNNYASHFRFRTNRWFRHLYRAFRNPKKIVSVDTNSINVIRALWPELSPKMTFIPNFVDRQLFFPPPSRNNDKLIVLFPRRSQINRGSRILADILKNVPHNVDFYWVGEGDDYDTQLILDLCKKDARLHYANASFEQMPEWYRKADIVVIPTIASEGTSLSCIEALASGCATIATNVGGLTDIIRDGVNGRLVNPTPLEIATAINELITDAQKRTLYQQQGLASAEFFSLDRWRAKWIEVLRQEQWIELEGADAQSARPYTVAMANPRTVIVTRNAIHGGVESLIKLESEGIGADVIVAGGLNDPYRSCPFRFTYVETYEELRKQLKKYDAVLYHWPFEWAVQAIKDSGLPSIEVVHRTDTAECDKTVPTLVVSHSQYMIDYLKTTYGLQVGYLPNAVDMQRFFPSDAPPEQCVIGAITSYYDTKGIDLVLQAWAMIAARHPQVTVRFYGAGSELPRYQEMAQQLGVKVEFCGPTIDSASTLREYSLFIHPSRVEGLPVVVLEALATGLPVIASDIEGHTTINRLAEEMGFPPPLTLFEAENVQDLAQKIEQVLAHPLRSNWREFVEAAFSARRHNTILQELLDRVIEEHPKTAGACFECIDHSWNNGSVAKPGQAEGFQKTVIADPSSGRLLFTHEDYLIYDYTLPAEAEVVSAVVHTANKDICNVFGQINWVTEKDIILNSVGFPGRMASDTLKRIYIRGYVPTNQRPAKIQIIARPNPQETLLVDHIEIFAWKKA